MLIQIPEKLSRLASRVYRHGQIVYADAKAQRPICAELPYGAAMMASGPTSGHSGCLRTHSKLQDSQAWLLHHCIRRL